MDYSKILNSKTFKVAAWIALPTILVAGFYGYKYIKNKVDSNKKSEELKKMQEKYKEINSVDEFIEGVKYLDKPYQYGYDFNELYKKKIELEKMSLDKLKRLYELAKKGFWNYNNPSDTSVAASKGRTEKEDEEFLELIHIIYP
jgi:hypothetical protein